MVGDRPYVARSRGTAPTPATPLTVERLTQPKAGFVVPIYQWLLPVDSSGTERSFRNWTRQIVAKRYS